MLILLVSDGLNYTSEQQFAPCRRYAKRLGDAFGIVFLEVSIPLGRWIIRHWAPWFSVVGLKIAFRTDPCAVENLLSHFRSHLSGTSAKLVYFDGDDDLLIQWPIVLKYTDLYLKKQIFSRSEDYSKAYIGKSNLTDYVSRTYGVDFSLDEIPKSGKLERDEVQKIRLGWNIGLDDRIVQLRLQLRSLPPAAKDWDIVCRAAAPSDWIFQFRDAPKQRLRQLAHRYKVMTPDDRVPQDQYYNELRRAKICVSPFGYGEICWRDFEAVLCGALLVKPDMSHLRTRPDIFAPNVSYVPVQWDYADLEERCAYFLENESERAKIVSNAARILEEFYSRELFVDSFIALLTRLGVAAARPSSASAASTA